MVVKMEMFKNEFLLQAVWSTSLKVSQLHKAKEFLSRNNFLDISVSLVKSNSENFSKMFIDFHFTDEKSYKLITGSMEFPEESVFLVLETYCSGKNRLDYEHGRCINAANLLRLAFGSPIARDIVFFQHKSLDGEKGFTLGTEKLITKFDRQELFIDGDELKFRKLSPEVGILVDAALSPTSDTKRFIMLWLAFEAVTNSFPYKGSNGEKRSHYYKEELGSDIADREVFRLFKIRNDLFKEGVNKEKFLNESNWSLYLALRLGVMEECPGRSSYLKSYEEYIIM